MKAKHITSARQLARLVDRSNSTVSEWLHRADWKFGQPPWKSSALPQIQQWMQTLRDTATASPDLQAARLRKENALATKYQLQTETERATYVTADDVRAAFHTVEATFRRACRDAIAPLADRCAGMDPATASDVLTRGFGDLLRDVAHQLRNLEHPACTLQAGQ